MKELIKRNWFKLIIVLGMFLFIGILSIKEHRIEKRNSCIKNCHSLVSQDKEFIENNLSTTKLLKKCSEVCNYLPNSF